MFGVLIGAAKVVISVVAIPAAAEAGVNHIGDSEKESHVFYWCYYETGEILASNYAQMGEILQLSQVVKEDRCNKKIKRLKNLLKDARVRKSLYDKIT